MPQQPCDTSMQVAPVAAGTGKSAVVALDGCEVVADLEMQHATGEDAVEIDRTIDRLGARTSLDKRRGRRCSVGDSPSERDTGRPPIPLMRGHRTRDAFRPP